MKHSWENADKGAETAVWLATSPDVEGLSGRYYTDKKEIKSNPISYDLKIAERLWRKVKEWQDWKQYNFLFYFRSFNQFIVHV